jgi:hypothetical protein
MQVTIEIPFLLEPSVMVQRYLRAVFRAHQKAAKDNPNVSSQVVQAATFGSSLFRQGVMAAIGTMGVRHAPIGDARWGLMKGWTGPWIPGWGNSFHKGKIDPAWDEPARLLSVDFPDWQKKLDAITNDLHAKGKMVYPNAAAFSAIACELVQLPWGLEDLFFLLPRLPIWAQLCMPKQEQKD